jgi:uncharacterized protein YjbI with pentapeptide repeats
MSSPVQINGAQDLLTAIQSGQRYFPQAELENADLSGLDLSGINLQQANLRGANLSATHLQQADLSQADLSEADLSEANIYDLAFSPNGNQLASSDCNGGVRLWQFSMS